MAAGASGTLANTAAAAVPAGVTDPVPANNAATDVDTLTPQADLSLTKSDGVASLAPGQATTWTVRVTNNGPSSVTGATVADTVPASIAGVTWACAITIGTGSCGAASGSGNAISTTVSLNSGAVATYTVAGTVAAGASGTLANTAAAAVPAGWTDPTAANNSATDTDTLTPQSDLAVTKTDGSASAVPGTAVSYTVTVTSSGPSNVTAATFTDPVPASMTGVTWTCSISGTGSCGAASAAGNAISTTVSLNAGAVATYTVAGTVAAGASGTLANTASAAVPAGWTDPTPANNSATDTDTLTPQSDLAVTKTDGSASAVPGTAVSYTVTVTNSGPSNVTAATFTDPVPASVTGVNLDLRDHDRQRLLRRRLGCRQRDRDDRQPQRGRGRDLHGGGDGGGGRQRHVGEHRFGGRPGRLIDPTPANNSATDTDTLTPQSDLRGHKDGRVGLGGARQRRRVHGHGDQQRAFERGGGGVYGHGAGQRYRGGVELLGVGWRQL